MKIKMTSTRYGSEDGFTIRRFSAGVVYSMADSLAASFVNLGCAISCIEPQTYGEKYIGALNKCTMVAFSSGGGSCQVREFGGAK